METIEKISFTVNGVTNTFQLNKYEEVIERKVKVRPEIGEVTSSMGCKYVDTKLKITKYALHRVFESKDEYSDVLLCESESYVTILKLLKMFLNDYIKTIDVYIPR